MSYRFLRVNNYELFNRMPKAYVGHSNWLRLEATNDFKDNSKIDFHVSRIRTKHIQLRLLVVRQVWHSNSYCCWLRLSCPKSFIGTDIPYVRVSTVIGSTNTSFVDDTYVRIDNSADLRDSSELNRFRFPVEERSIRTNLVRCRWQLNINVIDEWVLKLRWSMADSIPPYPRTYGRAISH